MRQLDEASATTTFSKHPITQQTRGFLPRKASVDEGSNVRDRVHSRMTERPILRRPTPLEPGDDDLEHMPSFAANLVLQYLLPCPNQVQRGHDNKVVHHAAGSESMRC